MPQRRFEDWLTAYVHYASVTEAPTKMAFWAGVSTIAGALRRKVWIDMKRFKWYPNFYIVFVAPPGIVGKSSAVDMAMNLLRKVPGIKFGPDIVTWPALVQAFAGSCESFQLGEEWLPMSAFTLVASEMGSLINLQDREMINLYITLWDGRNVFEKVTKTSGSDVIEGPWINMLACTTPKWLSDNMPPAAIGGGFTSRCIFVYADEKSKYIPFVDELVGTEDGQVQQDLVHDLECIATELVGPFTILPEARQWYAPVYEEFWRGAKATMDTVTLEGYAARKQTLLFKTAMIISASQGSSHAITLEQLQLAHSMLEALEEDIRKVFAQVGRSEEAIQSSRLLEYIQRQGVVSYENAYKFVHNYFPNFSKFEDVLNGLVRSNQLRLVTTATGMHLEHIKSKE